VKISVAMIVRDEEAMLPGCLESLGPCELVVVDTGSRDRTKEIAKAAGARIIDFTWCDDFAKARNFALEHCTGEWVLYVDADERVSGELWAELEKLPDTAGAAAVLMRNVQAHGHVREARLLRVFRRDDSIRFKFPIHEDVSESVSAYLQRTGKKLVELKGGIEHLGYERAYAASRGKRQRDQALLEKHLAADPTNLYSHFKLLEQARFWGDAALALQWAPKARAALDQAHGFEAASWAGELVVLVANVLFPKSPGDALAFLEAYASRIAPSAAWQLRRAELLELLGHPDASRAAFAACVSLRGQLGDLQLSTVRPRMGLARLAWAEGNLTEALAWTQGALALAPEDPEAQLAYRVLSAQRTRL
jgi:hypothetical protein